MGPYRQVPQIGRGPSQFAQEAKPPVQHPMAGQPYQMPPPMPQSPEQAISEQMHDLAMEIYCRVIAQHIAADHTDREAMQTLAFHSQAAAKAYFESMGVQFQS